MGTTTAASTASTASTAVKIPVEAHGRRLRELRRDVLRLVDEVISEGVYHSGPRTRGLEEAVQQAWGGNAHAASSGTLALETAVRALELGEGDEVIVPDARCPTHAGPSMP